MNAWLVGCVALGTAGCGAEAPSQDVGSGGGIASATMSTSGAETDGETEDPDTGGPGCSDAEPCPDGQVCDAGSCVDGCTATVDCGGDLTCCDGDCVDLTADAAHCGNCGEACGDAMACEDGSCLLGECEAGRYDCNGDPSDGCEAVGECACAPGETQDCYSGDMGTMGVGACAAGVQVCSDSGTGWGSCDGEVTPSAELCANGEDDDCNGLVDEDIDADGDGFSTCSGDCCDAAGTVCTVPELVNPGAFEDDANMVDDDCDGTIDNPLPPCDMGLVSNSGDPLDYARAIDLCQFTEEAPADPADQTWGVISASLELASGGNPAAANSRSIRDGFGTNIVNEFGSRLAVLSTGNAADSNDTSPGYVAFQPGVEGGTASGVPADWLAANGGNLPNAPGCPEPDNGATANNPVNLKLRVRAPTNANSFSVSMFFFSSEYPEWVCTPFNDFFVTLIDSTDPENPADKNIAIYDDGGQTWPVGINLVSAAPGLFTACNNGGIAQCGGGGTYNGCTSNQELQGTGFDVTATANIPFTCNHTAPTGGGTGWLRMTGAVEPGEIFEIRFVIWDTSDTLWDSLVLLDNWQWSVEASPPGVEPG